MKTSGKITVNGITYDNLGACCKALSLNEISVRAHQVVNGCTTEDAVQHFLHKPITLELQQNETYTAILQCLEEHHVCNIERPTGFGKTRLFAKYIQTQPQNKVLYVYDVITARENFQRECPQENVDYISYYRLSRKKTADETARSILEGEYNTVIFDESHLMGGENISVLLEKVIPQLLEQGVYILGGTATPIRTDGVDVTEKFFQNIRPYDYTINDAFDDGIMEIPLYTIMVYSQQRLERAKKKYSKNSRVMRELKQLEYAYAKRKGEAEIYRNHVLELYGKIPTQMRFIAFYPNIKSMNDNSGQLTMCFQEAFPGKHVYLTPVSSDVEHSENYELLFQKSNIPDSIEIITAVNMLNQSFHADDLTGIIMNRSTMSNVLFYQQLGRCLSVSNNCPAIVFDNVANCEKEPLEIVKQMEDEGPVGAPRNGRDLRSPIEGTEYDVTSKQKKPSEWTGRLRSRIKPRISETELQFAKALKQIIETQDISDEKLAEAIRCYKELDVPTSESQKYTGVPEWMLVNALEGKTVADMIEKPVGE